MPKISASKSVSKLSNKKVPYIRRSRRLINRSTAISLKPEPIIDLTEKPQLIHLDSKLLVKSGQEDSYKTKLESLIAELPEKDKYAKELNDLLDLPNDLPTFQQIMDLEEIKPGLKRELIKELLNIHHDPRLDKMFDYSCDNFRDAFERTKNGTHPKTRIDAFLDSQAYEPNLKKSIKEFIFMDSSVTHKWCDTLLSLPTDQTTMAKPHDIQDYLQRTKQSLDQEIYGLESLKNELLLSSLQYQDNTLEKKTIALIGPKGIGKKSIAELWAKSLDIPYASINLSQSNLRGKSLKEDYAGPGLILKTILEMKSKRGLIYLQMSDRKEESILSGILGVSSKSSTNILPTLTDPKLNHQYIDHYLGDIPIDLSQYIFVIGSTNDDILKETKSYVKPIYLKAFNQNERIEVAQLYLSPKLSQVYDLDPKSISISNEIMEYIVKYVSDSNEKLQGVSKLSQVLDRIYSRVKLYKTMGTYPEPYEVNTKWVKEIIESLGEENEGVSHLIYS